MLELVQIIHGLRGDRSPLRFSKVWPMAYASDGEDEDDDIMEDQSQDPRIDGAATDVKSRYGPLSLTRHLLFDVKTFFRDSTPRPIPALTGLLQHAAANPSQEYPSPPPTSERPRTSNTPTTPRPPVATSQMWRMRSTDIPESSSPVAPTSSSPGPSRFYDCGGPSNAILFGSPVCFESR